MVVARGCRVGVGGEMLVKGHKLPGLRRISSEGLMYSMVTVVNNAVLHS